MKRWLAALWLLPVLLAAGYLGYRIEAGLNFRSDLLALLPREEHDPALQRAHETMAEALSRRVLLLIGHTDRTIARQQADAIEQTLLASGSLLPGALSGNAGFAAIGSLYAAHAGHLLSAQDREALLAGHPEQVTARAMAQIYSPVLPLSAGLLRQDPFLLLPAFIADLPRPSGRAQPDGGRLSVIDQGAAWYLVELRLNGVPTDLDVQEAAVQAVNAAFASAAAAQDDIRLLRLGAVFFAEAGARSGLREASWLGGLSLAGTALLLLLVFRSARPLFYNLLSALVGILVALAGSLWVFGELHVGTLLFGTGLIGVVVDYSLHYSATTFDPVGGKPAERLRRIRPALWLGLGTTLIGYAALAAAPLPGLHQIAVFSILGLIAAFLCVLLWLPLLDRQQDKPAEGWAFCVAARLWPIVAAVAQSRWRWPVLLMLIVLAGTGLTAVRTDDNVRRLQSLASELVAEQQKIQAILGGIAEPQFLLVQGEDDEAALQLQERLAPLLRGLQGDGALQGYVMPAAFLPSAARQRENARLVRDILEPAEGAALRQQLGLPATPAAVTSPLRWQQARQADTLPFLDTLVLWPGGHAILLQGLRDPAALHKALTGIAGVTIVDPANDISGLLQRYRERIQWLLGATCLLLLPLLAWRYGWGGAFWVALPPALALALAPGLLALLGQAFTLFHTMALVLILSIGIDYAIFIAESAPGERPVALLGTILATITTQLSFGLLSLSSAPAVAGFGLTMLIGISVACLLAPLAGAARQHGHRA